MDLGLHDQTALVMGSSGGICVSRSEERVRASIACAQTADVTSFDGGV